MLQKKQGIKSNQEWLAAFEKSSDLYSKEYINDLEKKTIEHIKKVSAGFNNICNGWIAGKDSVVLHHILKKSGIKSTPIMWRGINEYPCMIDWIEKNKPENLPQVLLMENVPQVHGTKNINDFNLWIDFLKSKGYSNFWQDLNAKDYGVAQNRKRCFMVSILGNEFYEFSLPVKLNKCIKDYLEDEVDEKYYIKSEKAFKLILDLQERGILESAPSTACLMNLNKVEKVDNDVAKTLCARDYKGFGTGFDVQNGVIEWQKVNQMK